MSNSFATELKKTLIKNCRVYTMNESAPTAEVIIYQGDKIIFVGTQKESKKFLKGEVEILDLKGAVVLPGLMDAHAHLYSLGKYLDEMQLRGIDSPLKIRQLVLEKIADLKPGEWIIGRGWDQNLWTPPKFPACDDLSGTEANPVLLKRVDGHAIWVNSTALQICGISAETPDPAGGQILRYPDGKPTGILLDNAVDLVIQKVPPYSPERRKKQIIAAMRECNRYGLTTVGDAWINADLLDLYQTIISEGSASLRIYGMLDNDPALLDEFFRSGPLVNFGSGFLAVRAIKLFADGALGSRGALLCEPYSDDPSNSGLEITSEDSIYNLTKEALKHGFQVCTHAIGDKANNNVLNGYERALKEVPVEDHRLRIEHAQVLKPADIPRFARLKIIASLQPTHATSDMRWAPDRLGSERIKYAYAWRSLLNAGAKIASGSDFPVEEVNPLLGIYSAVTRKDLKGEPEGGWYPEQCLSIYEALKGFTADPAYAQFQEDCLGKIKAGYYADFTILNRDIFQIPFSEIPEIQMQMTIVGGKIVYQKGN